MLKVLLPAVRAALEGRVALMSLELIVTVSFVPTTFQLASAALTVTLNAVPAGSGNAAPILPPAAPRAAVSPGTSNCIFTRAPEVTVITRLPLAVMDRL